MSRRSQPRTRVNRGPLFHHVLVLTEDMKASEGVLRMFCADLVRSKTDAERTQVATEIAHRIKEVTMSHIRQYQSMVQSSGRTWSYELLDPTVPPRIDDLTWLFEEENSFSDEQLQNLDAHLETAYRHSAAVNSLHGLFTRQYSGDPEAYERAVTVLTNAMSAELSEDVLIMLQRAKDSGQDQVYTRYGEREASDADEMGQGEGDRSVTNNTSTSPDMNSSDPDGIPPVDLGQSPEVTYGLIPQYLHDYLIRVTAQAQNSDSDIQGERVGVDQSSG